MEGVIIGIDPGKTGAWFTIGMDGQPVMYSKFSSFMDFKHELCILQKDVVVKLAVLEEVGPRPLQGRTSIFTFGSNYGGWLATLELLEVPHIVVRPQAWQKVVLGSVPKGESKQCALQYAQRRLPQMNFKKKDDGLVDAFCIAEYGRKNG